MTWTRHPDYLTRDESGVTIDWTPDEGPKLSMVLDSLTPTEFQQRLSEAQTIATHSAYGAQETWEAPCDPSES